VAAGLIGGLAFNFIWWALLSPDARASAVEEVTIPAGTAAAIERGDAFPFLPQAYGLRDGGTLLVRNEDSAPHRVGTEVIPPGQSANITALAEGQLVCTVHPAGYLDIDLRERPAPTAMILPSLLLGLPLGLLAAATTWIIGRAIPD
jgi:hypothetical protein